MKYSELDISKLDDNDIYDLVMLGIVDHSKEEVNETNNPDVLVVLGCSPRPLKARIVKAIHLFQKGYGKNILITGGTGYHKLFKVDKNKRFKSDKEKYEYMKKKAKKHNEMKKAILETMPEQIKPKTNMKHGKALYRHMHRKIEQSLEEPETSLGYLMIKSFGDSINIKNDNILLEPDSMNTKENAENSKALLDDLVKKGKIDEIKKIMIITSSYHCRRAQLSFKKRFPDAVVDVCPSTIDIKSRGLSLSKEEMIKSPYYLGRFKEEINAIVNYSKNESILDADIEDYVGKERAKDITKKVKNEERELD